MAPTKRPSVTSQTPEASGKSAQPKYDELVQIIENLNETVKLLSKQLEEERAKNNGGNPRPSPTSRAEQPTVAPRTTETATAPEKNPTASEDSKEQWTKVGSTRRPRPSQPTSSVASSSTSHQRQPQRMVAAPPPSSKKMKETNISEQRSSPNE
ncbi:hypothetical protein WN48_01116 [Eufriesea mexicana]|nr:hypothetical protein WN48_01116 [Eufriesea mexicana]